MRSRVRRAAAVWCGLVAMVPTSGLTAPQKPETARKAFDYRRPEPGEMRPNPPAGIGAPPRLLEYSPTAAMGEGSAGAAAPGEPPPATAASEMPAQGAPPPAAAPSAPTPVKAAPAPAPATNPPPTPAPAVSPPDLQALFATTVASSGIDGVPAALPAAAAPADPALRPAAERAWAALAHSLAESSAAWARRYPDRTPAALDRVEARSGPGRLTIVTAPGRLTGAFADPSP